MSHSCFLVRSSILVHSQRLMNSVCMILSPMVGSILDLGSLMSLVSFHSNGSHTTTGYSEILVRSRSSGINSVYLTRFLLMLLSDGMTHSHYLDLFPTTIRSLQMLLSCVLCSLRLHVLHLSTWIALVR